MEQPSCTAVYSDADGRPLKKHEMVRWYQPSLLVSTGLRAMLASSVGMISDNRELQVTGGRGSAQVGDYSNRDSMWLDYVSDLGDGWDATFAVAAAVAGDSVEVEDQLLARGGVLLLGGDQVYPAPGVTEYLERTFSPYAHACAAVSAFEADVYALPGNHDWYDGLKSFEDLFVHDGPDDTQWPFGWWRKVQSHSYFALKLPHDWWLLAPDVQLDGYLNPSQRKYFKTIVAMMNPGDRVILCGSGPEWIYHHLRRDIADEQIFQLDHLSSLMGECRAAGADIELVLVGDIHHFAHYAPHSDAEPHLITSGGGGAFRHSTHTLPESVVGPGAQGTDATHGLVSCYPTRKQSFALSLKNLLFPVTNWEVSLFMGFVYTMLVWLIETRHLGSDVQLADLVRQVLTADISILDVFERLLSSIPLSPEFAFIIVVITVGLILFNGEATRWLAIALGLMHTAFHMVGLAVTYIIALGATIWLQQTFDLLTFTFIAFLGMMLLFGGGVSGVVFGIFLIVSHNVFRANLTNACSALRVADFGNFTRMHIDETGCLTVYPIGIANVDAGEGRASDPALIGHPIRCGREKQRT